ncbi:MAG TPA: FMN-binding negative transcriptional regulator [Gemmatimonadaceae bacterium]|nr:FMN-binding negative transcriptional regulator [Gemmatimonadaceae bacterium]
MYVPRQFDETRVDTLHALIRAHPLGTLVTLTPDGLEANHTPFEIDAGPGEFGTLRGHLARANGQWRDSVGDVEALAVFHGPERYISPSWYATKRETGKVVPTWNYAVVHARGPLRVIEDRTWLRAFVERLTTRYEAGRADAWAVADAPADFIEGLLGAIVGIEIPIVRLTGKWKASQNRPDGDRDGVVEGLRREPGDAAAAMAELVRNARRG